MRSDSVDWVLASGAYLVHHVVHAYGEYHAVVGGTLGVLVSDQNDGVQVYQPVDGPLAGQTFYGIHRIVCNDPTCPSTDMVFSLRRHDDEETFEIVVDAKGRTLSRARTAFSSAAHSQFAEAFVSHLSEAHWNVIFHDLLRQRTALLDDASALALAYFDFSDLEYSIEHESAMVFFDTVFPFGRAFDLEVRRTRITLIDQYCLNSRCTCTDVVLSAIPAFGTVKASDAMPTQPLFTVMHDYQTHKATVLDELEEDSAGAAGRSARLYLDAPKADLKRISTLVRKRHRMMRDLYQKFRNRVEADGNRCHSHSANTLISPTPSFSQSTGQSSGGGAGIQLGGKTGRNQLCPCGSGRKYKHCCGR